MRSRQSYSYIKMVKTVGAFHIVGHPLGKMSVPKWSNLSALIAPSALLNEFRLLNHKSQIRQSVKRFMPSSKQLPRFKFTE